MVMLFVGIIRTPTIWTFMIFEIKQDYQILAPPMVENIFSFVIWKRYQPARIYNALLHQDGGHLPLSRTPPVTVAYYTRHVMHTDVAFIPPESSIQEAWQRSLQDEAPAYVVGTRNRLGGRFRENAWPKSVTAGTDTQLVVSLIDGLAVHVHPGHSLDVVLE